jgi:gliding motility-associated-like protein
MYRTLYFTILLCSIGAICQGQTDRTFWFVAPNVDANGANFNLPIVLRLTSGGAPASVSISLPDNPLFPPININLPANATQSVDLSAWVDLLQSAPANQVENKGMLVQSSADITAYYEVVSSYCSCNPEVFSLKGINALGTEFYVSSQFTYNIDTVRQPAANTSFDIVATEDQTTVNITPTQDIVGHLADIPFSVVLNRGQTYSATGVYRDMNHHLQGSYITASKPIAVTLKDDLVFGDGTCADLIGDQTIPTSVIGNQYIISKGYLIPQDRVFVLAVQDNTAIYRDGSAIPSVILNQGQSWTFNLSESSTLVSGDKKFYVYHLTGTGCELGSAIMPKLGCTGSKKVSIVRSSDDIFGVMLVTKNGDQNSFTLNGNSTAIQATSFSAVPGTGGAYMAATIDLSSFAAAGTVFSFANSVGNFQLGFLNGSIVGGARYGFFSDYKASTVQTTELDICTGGYTQLSAIGGVSYSWSPAAGLDNPNIASPVATPALPTTYRVLITDADGCVDSSFVTVNLHRPSIVVFPSDTCICPGTPVQLNSEGFDSYIWSPALGLSNANIANPISLISDANPGTSMTYSVKGSSQNGCTADTSITIRVFAAPLFQAPPGDSVCIGMEVALKSNNGAGFTYDWSPPTFLDNPNSAAPLCKPESDISYTLQIGDSLCQSFDSTFTVLVSVKQSPSITAEKTNDIDCTVHSVQLTATGAASYSWVPTGGLNDPLSPTPVASIDSTTVYVVKGTGANGCYSFDSVTVKAGAGGANTFVVPNAFTPNNDGRNDCFGITHWGDVRLEELKVFNRWGQLVFSTRDPSDCWDGTSDGQPQPAGSYPYIIRAHSLCGEITRTGLVFLIR